MSTLRRVVTRAVAFLRPGSADRDFKDELAAHLDLLTDENVRRGMDPAAARRAASIRVGGAASLAERHREIRGIPSLDTFLQDIRFAFRLIARNPWFSAAAIAALGLGIGMNAIGFTVVNAAFLRPLPFENSSQLLLLTWQPKVGLRRDLSYTELREWREHNRAFSGLAAFSNSTVNISDDHAAPEEARGTFVTGNLFELLGQQALLGRSLSPGDERPGADPVAVISHRTWSNRFGLDAGILGQTLRLNGRPATIVGVMPDGMRFPNNTDIWAPIIPDATQDRRSQIVTVFGRLRDDLSRTDAETEVGEIARRVTSAYPDVYQDMLGAHLETFTKRFIGGAANGLFIAMFGAVSFVLLIACTNVANMLLSRSVHRAREVAVRLAIGATRWRVIRQLILESVVLSLLGGVIGWAIAFAGGLFIERSIVDPDKPYWLEFTVDYVVFAYVAGICVASAVVFGLAPAMHVSKTNVNGVIKEGGRGNPSGRRSWSHAMVIAQLALTVVLLAGAGVMIRSFVNLYTLDIGIETARVTTMRMKLPKETYPMDEHRVRFADRLARQLSAVGGLDAVALASAVPPAGAGGREVEIDSFSGDQQRPNIATVAISPTFFDVLGAPVRRGRAFTTRDGEPGSETVIINERMAERFFRGEDPVGRRIRFRVRAATQSTAPGPPGVWRTIVGVSPSIRQGSLDDTLPAAVVYVPFRGDPPETFSVIVRSGLTPVSIMESVRREVQAIDPDQPVFAIQTLDEVVAENRWPYRVFGSLFVLFAAVALTLSAVGLYGVTAYWVTQRTHEIGVRMALGADVREVTWLILRRGLMQLAVGLPLGLAGSFVLTMGLRPALVQISPGDPLTLGAISIVLTVVAITACLLPARQASRVDPLVALRAD